MATGIVLPPVSGLKEWHDTESIPRPCPTSPHPSSLPSSSMARPPSGAGPNRDPFAQRPRLPSFSNFLSGVGQPELQFAPSGPGQNRQNPGLANDAPPPFDQNAVQPIVYGPSDQHPLGHPESFSRNRNPHPDLHHEHHDLHQQTAWPYTNSNPPERHPNPPGQFSVGPSDRPRGWLVIGEEGVPGKGECYVYDDGTAGQPSVNGDAVNPKWGTTKAGKPRKRLGQACNTCREKKIKCDPNVPKCAQCMKFGRECKFDPASRSGQRRPGSLQSQRSASPLSSTTDQMQDAQGLRRGSTASTDLIVQQDRPLSRGGPKVSMTLEPLVSPARDGEFVKEEARDQRPPAKKLRFSASPRPGSEGWPSESLGIGSASVSTSSPSALPTFSWRSDPYEVDRDLTFYYLEKYFTHADSATYSILPRKQFTRWVRTSRSKSSDDKMLLYVILAMGTVYAGRPGADEHRLLFVDIVYEALLKHGDTFNLQLVQTRLILALFAFSQGQYNRAWDSCGSAVRVAFGLKFNTEEGVAAMGEHEEPDFGLDYTELVECRRRTFWSAYIMDCFNGCCSGSVTTISREDCHLRLPCAPTMAKSGDSSCAPYSFDSLSNGHNGAGNHTNGYETLSQVGPLGFLVEIATIFNQVVSRVSRIKSQASTKSSVSFDTFFHDTTRRLSLWDKSMTSHSRKNQEGVDNPESVSGLHILYHYTTLVLHRYIRYTDLDQLQISVHAKGAYTHARLMLELVQRLSNNEETDGPLFRFGTTSPLAGFAITAALDVITATGTYSDLVDHNSQMMSLISSGVEALERLVDFWHSARRQRDMIKQRLAILLTANQRASDRHGAFFFGQPMQIPYGLEYDLVYALPRTQYFQALRWDRFGGSSFHRLDSEAKAIGAI